MLGTVPNMLTVARICAAPCLALAFLVLPRPLADWVAFGIFVAAALTDWLDGWLARRLGQESAIGKMLDPIADKAMVLVALLVLAGVGYGQEWLFVVPAVAIVLREVLIAGLREHLGAVKLDVTDLAKLKTGLQMFAIGVLLLMAQSYATVARFEAGLGPAELEALRAGEGTGDYFRALFWVVYLGPFALGMLWVAALLTVITGRDYFLRGLAYIRAEEERRKRP